MDPQAERIAEAKRAADAKVQAKLDAVHDRFSGPYTVNGASVPARPMFRMNVNANNNRNELVKICQKAHVPGNAINNACMGRPTPEQLVQVTQALIDAGKLPAEDAKLNTVEKRIRNMQFEWGIGVDCAGYVREAATAVHGKGAQSLVNGTHRYGAIYSYLQTPAFKKVAFIEGGDKKVVHPKIHNMSDIRAGDIIHLDPNPNGQEVFGHNVIVHSHEVHEFATYSLREDLNARSPGNSKVDEFLKGTGPFHVLNVDSSWGAGSTGEDFGGFRRDTWYYDESSRKWGYFDHQPPREFKINATGGPQDEIFTGAFRPASAK
ncbi:MAG: hypothetical protein FWD73_01755 [Polyangiaceae bacterium]|nr:hypothetical protein [Polyangiaceae bacterium]